MATLDTTIYKKLLDAKFTKEQAETVGTILSEHVRRDDNDLARKTDIDRLENRINILDSKANTNQWLTGAVFITIIVSIFLSGLR